MQLEKRLVAEVLRSAASKHPDKPYMFYQGKAITFKELDQKTDQLAGALLQDGFKRGDNLAIVALNQPEWLYTYFAAAKIGIGLVALNVRYRESEFNYMLNNSEAKGLVCIEALPDFNFKEFFHGFQKNVPGVEKYYFLGSGFEGSTTFESLLERDVDLDQVEKAKTKVTEDDTVIIIYTSGTTGKPKGTMITNKSILASAEATVDHFQITEKDRMIGVMPLNHVGGITCLVSTSLLAGGSIVLIPYFQPDLVLKAIEQYQGTIFGGVPTMYIYMFNHPDFEQYDTSSLRLCIAGGSNVEPKVCRAIEEKFPNGKLVNLYGLTETSGACVLSRLTDDTDRVAESIGVIIGDFQGRIVDENRQDLPIGEVGELAIKGDCVAKGYYNMEDETSAFTPDGWVFTGDMACLDEEGYVYLKGRKKEMYIQGGYNIYPVEIENILTQHPKVQIAAVIGVPDPKLGEIGRCYIVPGDEVDEDELKSYCRQYLADYKVPRQFVFVDELPLTPAGKVMKSTLKQSYLEGNG